MELIFGNLKAAEDAFRQVLDLGRIQDDQRAIAVGYGNLGVIAMARGDLEAAVDYYNQALALDEELGRKEGMAMQIWQPWRRSRRSGMTLMPRLIILTKLLPDMRSWGARRGWL